MTWWQGAVLGLVQGLTEFLPVSSDGHLDVAKALMHLPRSGLVFDLVVHVGTLCAVFVMYRRRLSQLVSGAVRADRSAWRYIGLLAVGTVPAGIAGLWWEDFFSQEFPLMQVGVQFLVTGAVLWPRPVGDQLHVPGGLPGVRQPRTQADARVLVAGGGTLGAGCIQVKQGSSGSAIKVVEYDRTISERPDLVTKRTVYESDASGGSSPQDTTYAYTFYNATSKRDLKQITITHPSVSTGKNGPNVSAVEKKFYDKTGKVRKQYLRYIGPTDPVYGGRGPVDVQAERDKLQRRTSDL